ncbi:MULTISPECIES: FxsB family cyclophane-forming radical SAM/SPASM peptide maturase [Pseudofrankia]|uniref:FxsB family cyclophane-forming radical SAM/SPASM peptide maturase n=1 Tax=Pseudofrankia TaxID=2994363 RepID=UPI000234C5B1|nr:MULTISPECIES: FxsB family cyclophane-forming radical SAM/SPASM peptide maturase [Pseudofrankia]OHV37118.1 hypothetical protein BCD49_18240 [Pseudofrankia sp. EUN1h]
MDRVQLPLVSRGSGAHSWPGPSDLDFDDLVSSGWRPEPFRLFLCKIHTRCNLNCDYCYVYNLADQSWREKPRLMDEPVIHRLAERIRDHVRTHDLEKINIVLHGGEPLLAGLDYIRRFVSIMQAALGDLTEIVFLMQSNGTLLDEATCQLLAELDIRLGISLDGERRTNDVHRPFRNGQPSYNHVERALRLLEQPEYRKVFGAILCVIDIEEDPLATYNQLLSFNPPGIDFLFRLGDADRRPPGKEDLTLTPYADWLIQIFDHWYLSRKPPTQIRIFQEIMHLILGGTTGFESIGLSPVTLITIDTGGELEGVDSLKAVFDGAPSLAMNVFTHSFDDALRHPSVIARQVGVDALHHTCLACEVRDVCGGGYYPHRFRAESGFRNPSVYCADLLKLILHIAGRMRVDVGVLRTANPRHEIIGA